VGRLSRNVSPRPSILLAAILAASPAVVRPASPAPPLSRIVDLAGHEVDPLHDTARLTVFVFTRTDCPISNRYAPELRRLHDRYAARGARFWLVYPDPSESTEEIRHHQSAFGLGFDALRDDGQSLVRLTGATVTPEAAVFVREASGPRMVYRGRIDDRAIEPGRTRVTPTRRDLAEVLEAVAAGETVPVRTTTAVGCFIPALP
jgi:hypothetical protein